MPRRSSWTSPRARSSRRFAVHVVRKTIGFSRNESACARCLLGFTRGDTAGPLAGRSRKIAERAFDILAFQREGAPAPFACSARGFCSDFVEMGTLRLGVNIDHIATLRQA